MPPGFWSKFLWAFLHGICQVIDQMITLGTMVLLIEVAQFLRAFCRLLPCPECKFHFTTLLQTDLLTKPPKGYFVFSVEARAKIAKRLGRPVRDENYCRQEYNTEWFALAWNALQIMSFAYPLVADNSFQADMKYFFQFLGKFFPSALATDWSSTIEKIGLLALNPVPNHIPMNQRQLMTLNVPGLVQESALVSEMAKNKFDTSKAWCATRENFMHTVYTLRRTVQKTPLLHVPPFETLVQQWVNDLTQYVVQFRTGTLNKKDESVVVKTQQNEGSVVVKTQEVEVAVNIPSEKNVLAKGTLEQLPQNSKYHLKRIEKETQLHQKKLDSLELQLRLTQEDELKKKQKENLQRAKDETLRSELEALKKAFDAEKLQFETSRLALEEERKKLLNEKKTLEDEKNKFKKEKFMLERNQKLNLL